ERGARPAQPLAAGRLPGRPGDGVVHGLGRRSLRARSRPRRRGRALHAPAAGGGQGGPARGARGPRRPAGPPCRTGDAMSGRGWALARFAAAAAVLAAIVWRLGTGPFLDGIRALYGR